MRPGSRTLAALWGFAEATLFFIVPDVLLTSLALRSLRKALWACLIASVTAALGGSLVWLGAVWFPDQTHQLLLHVPGISDETFARVEQLLQGGFYTGMLQGAFSGVPYKTFAFTAGQSGVNPFVLFLLTPLARLPRFLLLALFVGGLSVFIGNRLPSAAKLAISLALWAVFYTFYFSAVGW
ncbi:YqaA family protein [Roseibium sp. SCP14]|uniref:YqaA family protein n=1 Tax=Roseibium sp. SCP14 TaxID=3141375 RepID=UPI00333B590B